MKKELDTPGTRGILKEPEENPGGEDTPRRGIPEARTFPGYRQKQDGIHEQGNSGKTARIRFHTELVVVVLAIAGAAHP